jgi:hypothetical protein
MYSTCMFCEKSLGTNEVIESFPVGRRLAFDEARGRLWVVCTKCERWNLSPLEERWEAVEACERLFRETRLRASSENIGMARLREGLELVRIGAPVREEFAAWRYGDQFGRRRKKHILYTAGITAAVLGVGYLGPMMAGMSVSGGYGFIQLGQWAAHRKYRTDLRTEDGRILKVNVPDLATLRLRQDTDGEGLRLGIYKNKKREWFSGPEAERFASRLIPKVNRGGGGKSAVEDAVREIERAGHPERFVEELVSSTKYAEGYKDYGSVSQMPKEITLALEMALHEEDERRAMEGELWRLERAWEQAEEIAAISDALLLPEGVEDRFDQLRKESAGG